jgi:hypothetical protein
VAELERLKAGGVQRVMHGSTITIANGYKYARSGAHSQGDITMEHLSIDLLSDDGDAAEIDSASRVLWGELSAIRGVKVEAARGSVPVNAKSADPGSISTLVLTVLGSHGLATMLTGVLKDFIDRNRGLKIVVKRGKDVVEITGAKPSDAGQLVPNMEKLLEKR